MKRNKADGYLCWNCSTQRSRTVGLSGSTLNSPVYKESPWAVSDIVKPAIVTVLQDPEEEEGPQPAARPQVSAALFINPSLRFYVPGLLERPWQGPASLT